MHKKLASDLTSLAHSILQMKNKEDVLALKEKAYEVYEKLAVLAYVEEYMNTTPHAEETKEELIDRVEQAIELKESTPENDEKGEIVVHKLEDVVEESVKEELTEELSTISTLEETEELKPISDEVFIDEAEEKEGEEEIIVEEEEIDSKQEESEMNLEEEILEKEVVEEKVKETTELKKEETQTNSVEEITEQPFDELEELFFGDTPVSDSEKDEATFIEETKTPTLEDELEDTLPVDVMADLFQKIEPQKTVNDLLQSTIQIGLNDRIAFVAHLFGGNQADYNRVISQLNTFKSEKEAKNFIAKMVKPDYDWSEKETYEARLLEIIERRFL